MCVPGNKPHYGKAGFIGVLDRASIGGAVHVFAPGKADCGRLVLFMS